MERIAVFSDVHADERALRSILDAAQRLGITRIWCLGDYCSGGPEPLECFELVRAHCDVILGGNHELFVVEKVFMKYQGGFVEAAYRAYLALGEERVAWLRTLPAHGEIKPLGVELVHASLRDPTHEFIRSAADAYMSLPLATQPTVLFGHSHRPACFIAAERGLPTELHIVNGSEYPLPVGRTCLLNPGSGCDEQGARWLELALDGEHRSAIWHQTDVPGHGGIFSITPE